MSVCIWFAVRSIWMIITVNAQWWSSKFYWRTKFPFQFSTASLYLNGCSQCEQRQPEIHLFVARFREQSGDIPGARAAYQLVHDEISPGLLEAIIKHANMEHRLVSYLSSSLDSRSYLEIAILKCFLTRDVCRGIWKMLVLYMNKQLK